MGNDKASIVLVASLLFSCLPVLARPNVAKQIDAEVAPFVRARHFSGVILAIDKRKIVYERAFGLASAELNVPNRVDTRFGIASITKLMTGVITNQLLVEHRLRPDDTVSKYIPGFPNGDKITIPILRGHRSGLPHRVTTAGEEAIAYSSAELVEKISNTKALFEPGERRLYSSAGYSVLARLLEIASGESYAQLLKHYVFDPVGMDQSLQFDSEAIMERRADEYILSPHGITVAPRKDYSFLTGAGSVFSTARDVYKFGRAIADGKFGETTRSAYLSNNEVSGSGFTNGHYAIFKWNETEGWGYVILSNLASGANDAIASGVESILKGGPPQPPVIPQPALARTPPRNLADFNGTFEGTRGEELTIAAKDDRLVSAEFVFYPTTPDCFFDYKFYGNVCFVRDDAGAVNRMEWSTPKYKLEFVKRDSSSSRE